MSFLKRINKKWLLIGIVLFLIIAQFFKIDRSVPEVSSQLDFTAITSPPQEVIIMLKDACYDCHSYETKYPWYFDVAPVSWYLKGHIRNGRKKLNFSTWGTQDPSEQRHNVEDCIEVVQENRMPLKSYTWTHSGAKLSQNQRTSLINWFKTKI